MDPTRGLASVWITQNEDYRPGSSAPQTGDEAGGVKSFSRNSTHLVEHAVVGDDVGCVAGDEENPIMFWRAPPVCLISSVPKDVGPRGYFPKNDSHTLVVRSRSRWDKGARVGELLSRFVGE